MEQFGRELRVNNKDNFNDIKYKSNMCRLRKHIYRFVLNGVENDFFDIDQFNRKYVKNINAMNEMINSVVLELNELGWKTYIGFGGTGLYIYSSEELPQGAY